MNHAPDRTPPRLQRRSAASRALQRCDVTRFTRGSLAPDGFALGGFSLSDLVLGGRALSSLIALGGALLLGGCAHTPPAPAPLQNIQSQWQDADLLPAEQGTDINARWWESFNDPILTELIDEAERNNLDLQLAALRVLEARALNRGADAGLWPQLTGALGAGRSRGTTGGTRNNFSAGLEATWEVDVTGRLSALARAADAGLAASKADARSVRLLLLAEVANAYVQYRLQHLLLAITEESVQLQEQTQKITLERYNAGVASQLDVQRGLSLLTQTRSQGAEAVLAADAARFVLAYLLATTPEQLAERITGENTLPQADVIDVLLTPLEVLEQRPDVHAAINQYTAAAAQYDAAEADRLPRLTLAGLIGLEDEKLSSIFEGRQFIWTAAGNLAAPLLDFGRRASVAEAADARRLQAQVVYEQVVRNALRETQTAVVSYLQGNVRHQELTASLEAAKLAAQVATYQYEEGVLSQLEVIDAEKNLHDAQRRWAVSGASVASALIQLYRVMGIAPEPSEQFALASEQH